MINWRISVVYLIVIFIYTILVWVILRIILLFLGNLFACKTLYDQEKSSPFECGFIPQTQHRTPFSLHFFLITILFLVFDVELVLLFPFLLWPWIKVNFLSIFLIILFLLTIGLIIEWSQKILEWAKFKQSWKHFAVNKD